MSTSTKAKKRREKNKILKKSRRINAVIYPIYKVFAWDLLCYYSIEYLFFTITKGLTPSQVLVIAAIYIIAKVLFQIPAVIISEYLGKRKGIIIGNAMVVLHMVLLINSPNFLVIVLSQMISGLGYDIKAICDGNLLYDSVATKGGDGLYTKLETKGGSGYFIVDAVLSVMSGYLFVINNYAPMIICFIGTVISLIISLGFKDIYLVDNKKRKSVGKFAKEYKTDIADSLKFIKRSNRMKSYLFFAAVFYALINIFDTYKFDLLTEVNIGEEQFAVIIALLSLMASISVSFTKKIQKQFKNRTLTFLSLSYILSWIAIGIVSLTLANSIIIPIILMFYVINRLCDSQWVIVKGRYLKNFTKPGTREKITFTFELVTAIAGGSAALIGAWILKITDIRHAIILVALGGLALIVIALDYMKTRFGLKPKEYTKEDIKFYI